MKLGVIDIGSNSVRFMAWQDKCLYKLVTTTRLAKGLNESGKLSAESVEKTLLALSDYITHAKTEGVDKLYCFATSAVRTAKNGQELVDAAREKLGLIVDVVSENTEAELGFSGALIGGVGGIIDIGGGSTEIQAVTEDNQKYRKSLPVGAVRLTDICGQSQEKLEEYIDTVLPQYGKVPNAEFVGIGGTATSVAAMLIGEEYNPEKVDGYIVTLNDLVGLRQKLFGMTVDERKQIKGLQPERADIIHAGAFMLEKIMRYIGARKITVSERDNLEGYVYKVVYEQKN